VSTLLVLDGVGKSYLRGENTLKVLTDVSLQLDGGEVVAVWGKRGVGKTTLLKIAAGLESPDCGAVSFDGRDMAGLSPTAQARLMREQIGWVRRTGPRSDLPMLEYVALPLMARHDRNAHAQAREMLDRVGLSALAQELWASLSDGERALVGIAHGVVRKPKLLLVDDPTANLDVRERERVVELLRKLAVEAGIGVLMTVPDMPATMTSHRIMALSGGRLLQSPSPPVDRENVIDFPRERSA